MIQNQGFADLRMSHAHGSTNEHGVWPSFTDVMTVIVMIFLMALVVILIRNVDLVDRLRERTVSEQRFSEIARAREAQRLALESKLGETERSLLATRSELETSRAALDRTRGEAARMNEKISAMLGEVAALERLRDRLAGEITEMTETNRELDVALSGLRASHAQLEEEKGRLESDKQDLVRDLALLQSDYETLDALRERLGADLTGALERVAALTTERGAALDENEALQARLDILNAMLAEIEGDQRTLETERTALTGQVTDLRRQVEEMTLLLAALRESNARAEREKLSLVDELGRVRTSYALSAEQLALIRNDLLQREADLDATRGSLARAERQVVALKGDYVDLEAKYTKLLRPARSDIGRYVVAIRFSKSGGANLYEIRKPGESGFRAVSLEVLHRELSEIAEREVDNVYTRIIIPDDSGLSYREAWTFTNEIQNRYDYYFR